MGVLRQRCCHFEAATDAIAVDPHPTLPLSTRGGVRGCSASSYHRPENRALSAALPCGLGVLRGYNLPFVKSVNRECQSCEGGRHVHFEIPSASGGRMPVGGGNNPVAGNRLRASIRNTPAAAAGPASRYVFCYFTNGGEDGLHLALSDDGYHYTALHGGKSYLAPAVGESKLFRDPCILLGPDGVYRMVWTDSWTGVTIGYSSSSDLIHWSPQRAIDVNKNHPTALDTWRRKFTGTRPISSTSSSGPARSPALPETAQSGDPVTGSDQKYNHRVYCTTTKDFETFTPSRLYFDPGYECIDATVLPADGRFYLIFKDETLLPIARKDLHTAVSTSMEGPFTDVRRPSHVTGLKAPPRFNSTRST